jgi:hypothetical protein
MIEEAAASAVDVGLAAVANGLNNLPPVAHLRLKFVEDAAADEPVAGMVEVFGGGVVAVLPDAMLVEDLHENVGADGEREARVEEVARVDNDGSTAAFCTKGAEGIEEIVDGTVTLEEMHVLDAAEETIECGGENDDGNVWTASAEKRGYLGSELALAEMVVEDCNVDVVEVLDRFVDGSGGYTLVAMLAEDDSAEMKIIGLVVKKKNTYRLPVCVGHQVKGSCRTLRRLDGSHTPL